MNERNTEKLTRKLLEKNNYFKNENLKIDEQISDNEFINSLFSYSSKNKTQNKGFPDFIIYNYKIKNFLIIIENKSKINEHSYLNYDNSENLKSNVILNLDSQVLTKYCIEGSLFYALKAIEKNNNLKIISIAISGDDDHNKFDSFFVEKNKIEKIKFGFSSFEKYKDYFYVGLKNLEYLDEEHQITKIADYINNILRDHYDLQNHLKPLFIAMFLLALDKKEFTEKISNEDFWENSNEKKLINDVYKYAIDKINDYDEDILQKTKSIKQYFEELKFHFEKYNENLNKKDFLKKISFELRDKILPLHKNANWIIDPIGIFYRRFLKYATGEGKELGIVLTPFHITELFCDLSNDGSGLYKDDKVLDTTAGTGGFLISAYKSLLEMAENKEDISNIKTKQLYGFESESQMFALSLTNMILLGDGKTNLFLGDSLLPQNKNKVDGRANKGFINPPYSKKNDDKNEFQFVFSLLESIAKNKDGLNKEVIAILPLGAIIKPKEDFLNLRKKILSKHTLKASITMPDNLFYPSASVNTAILIFEAGIKHDFDKKVWMHRMKEDGFELVKNLGRVETSEWKKIKDNLLSKYKNRETDKNNYNSVYVKINDVDEWVAEAYVKTDFSNLKNRELFEKKINDHIAYKFINNLVKNDILLNKKNNDVEDIVINNINKWKKYKYSDIFKMHKQNNKNYFSYPRIEKRIIEKVKIDSNLKDLYLYISSSAFLNGVTGSTTKLDESKFTLSKNVLTLANSGSVGSCFFQEKEFYGTDSIYKLEIKEEWNKYINNLAKINLFLSVLIEQEKYRYSFGRAWRSFRLEKDYFYLPVNNGKPDFDWIEKFMSSFKYSIFLD